MYRLSREEADSFSMKRRERERESVSFLYREEAAFFGMNRRECAATIQ